MPESKQAESAGPVETEVAPTETVPDAAEEETPEVDDENETVTESQSELAPPADRPFVPNKDTFQVTQPEEEPRAQTMKDHSVAYVAGASAVFVVVAGAFLPSIVTGGTKSSSLVKLFKGLIKH